MPSKKQRAQAKKAKKVKEVKEGDKNGVDSINIAALSLSVDEMKLQECDRLNKILYQVVDNFSSNFVMSKKYDGTICRHGCSDPISHRCQRMVDGVTEIFKEGVIKPEAVKMVKSELHSVKAHKIIRTFYNSTAEKKLSAVAAGDFGYQEERWSMSYLAALGTELILRGNSDTCPCPGAEVALFALATYIMSMSINENMGLNDGLAFDLANSEGKMVQESIKFFSKTNGCSCLEEKFNMKRVKKEASMSQCSNCKEENSKRKLYLCSRCSNAQYCSKDCQTKHWPEHKQDCSRIRKLIKKRATEDTYIMETVAYKFGDDGKVAGVTGFFPSEETWTAPRGQEPERNEAQSQMGGGYMVTKDGEKITLGESSVVPLQRVMANPKFQGIQDKCQSNPKARKAMEDFLYDDPSLTFLKYMNDPEISKFLSDLADVMKESGAFN